MLSAIRKSGQTLLALLILSGPALAHGAFVTVTEVAAISIEARYDTGETMAHAQVAVFAPDDPARPWLVGETDAQGRFVFTPDARAGRWAVQVRQAGHGAIGYVDTGSDGTAMIVAGPAGAGLGWPQKLLMAASVLWGAVGTALYFRRPRPAKAA